MFWALDSPSSSWRVYSRNTFACESLPHFRTSVTFDLPTLAVLAALKPMTSLSTGDSSSISQILDRVPSEVWTMIFEHAHPVDVFRWQLVCKSWQTLALCLLVRVSFNFLCTADPSSCSFLYAVHMAVKPRTGSWYVALSEQESSPGASRLRSACRPGGQITPAPAAFRTNSHQALGCLSKLSVGTLCRSSAPHLSAKLHKKPRHWQHCCI